MSDELAIDLQHVAKIYGGRIHALQDVEMRVRRGEVFGLLGPNGAGKSTLVKIMMTVVRATRAQGTILGHPVGHKPTLARVGYLPESHHFPQYLTGRQSLEFFAALSGVDRRTRRRRAAELLVKVGMAEAADRLVSTYSKGMMQRVGLAQALVADPDLVVLDEPTDGVDPVGRRDIRDVLADLRAQGKTIFINSHLLSELEMICERVAILVQGMVARQGTISELSVAKQRFEIEVAAGLLDVEAARKLMLGSLGTATAPIALPTAASSPPGPPGMPPQRVIERGTLPGGEWMELEGLMLRIGTSDVNAIQPIIDSFRQAGLIIRRVQLVRPSLEDLFMDAVSNPASEAPAPPLPARNKAELAVPA